MTKRLGAAVLCAGLAVPFACDYVSAAQQSKHAPPAPVPSLILTAKKVFIANGGEMSPFLTGVNTAADLIACMTSSMQP